MIDGTRQFSRRALGLGAAAVTLTAAGTATATVLLVGDDLDGSGTVDSSSGIQERIDDAPDGAVISIPAGVVLRSDRPITLRGDGKTLSGPGELRFTGGSEEEPALRVTGRGARVLMLTVTNRDARFERAVEIAASDVTVEDCWVDRFRYGIVVAAEGEWVDIRILGNRVTDVVGIGGGRGSDSPDGEDRGDGITVWGARATVVGNVVSAMAGTDARIGIHAEGLGDVAVDRPPHSDAMVTISGNVVTGPFRRSIVFEDLSNGVITGNTVADGTWWGIAVIGGTGCVVSGNSVRYTRTAEDDQGRFYEPSRSALHVAGGTGHTLSDNTVTVLGVAQAFVSVFPLVGGPPEDIRIAGNNCRTAGDGECAVGIDLRGQPGPLRPKLQGNTVVGVTRAGVALGAARAAEVSGNTVVASPAGCERGVAGESTGADRALVVGNRLTGHGIGVSLTGATAAVVSANVIEDCGTGVDLGSSSGVVLVGNVFPGSGAPVLDPGSNPVVP